MEVKDYLGNLLQEGDEVVRAGTLGRSPVLKKCVIVKINGRNSVSVLTEGNSKAGVTYADRLINLRFIHFPGKLIKV